MTPIIRDVAEGQREAEGTEREIVSKILILGPESDGLDTCVFEGWG